MDFSYATKVPENSRDSSQFPLARRLQWAVRGVHEQKCCWMWILLRMFRQALQKREHLLSLESELGWRVLAAVRL